MFLIVLAFLAADPKDRFANEYPIEVRQLKQEFVGARGVATVRSVKGNKLGHPTTFQFATGPGRRKFEFERAVQMSLGKFSVNSYGYTEIDGRNIEVQRNAPSAPYTVRGIGDDEPMSRMQFDTIFGRYLNASWAFVGFNIDDAVSRGWFSITEDREVEERGKSLVEITFQLTTMKEPNFYRIAFDPTLHWAITRASTWEADPSKPLEHYEATYGLTSSGHNYIKTLHWWNRDGKEKLCEFGPVEFMPTPASEFTLEHYGLKSPPLPAKKPNYLIVAAIALLAVVLLVAAWLTRRLAVRKV